MEKPPPADEQFSIALHYLHRVIVGKGEALDELRANNQELGTVLDRILSVRSDLRAALETDGFHGITYSPPAVDGKDLDLAELTRQAELLSKKYPAVIQESMQLRMRAKKVREAVAIAGDGHASLSEPEYCPLSKRERQVLALIVAGKSSKQIAAQLGISFKTAVTHRASIMGKMDVHEIASVVREAIRRGLA